MKNRSQKIENRIQNTEVGIQNSEDRDKKLLLHQKMYVFEIQ